VFLTKKNRKKVFPSLNKFVVILFALILSLVVVAAFADENQLSLSPIDPEFQGVYGFGAGQESSKDSYR